MWRKALFDRLAHGEVGRLGGWRRPRSLLANIRRTRESLTGMSYLRYASDVGEHRRSVAHAVDQRRRPVSFLSGNTMRSR